MMIPPSLVAFARIVHIAAATREDLIAGVTRLSSDVIELRNELESSISKRCSSIRGCYQASFDECRSKYTADQHCPSNEELGYSISECGTGKLCNGLFDNSITTVRMPSNLATGENGNPRNPEVVEAVCYTRMAEKWMVRKHDQDRGLWRDLGVSSPQMYFGSSTGVFRIFPARQSRECGVYDPRLRPWYQASLPTTISNSVKPRKVVILMDTSRSMNETMNKKTGETKLSYMKKAVVSTVSTLSENASIAVIRFGEAPSLVGRPGSEEPFLWRLATAGHKSRLKHDIDEIEARGRSNWIAGFKYAYTLIRNSLRHISAKDEHSCKLENIAILFFSDGKYNMPAGVTAEEIVEYVSSSTNKIEAMGDYSIYTFLYSLGNTDANQALKQVSCAVEGYWTPVTSTMAPENCTVGYHALFSTPMGTEAFYNYTSWSAPYNFSTSKELGYTVSSLVYNRGVEPPRYMGAVGMDISAEAARTLYGANLTGANFTDERPTMEETLHVMNEIISNIKEMDFNTTCDQQRIRLNRCEVQSLRQFSGGNEAICLPPKENLTSDNLEDLLPAVSTAIISNITNQNWTANAADLPGNPKEIEIPTETQINEAIFENLLNCSKGFLAACPGYDEYPDDLWKNVYNQGKKYRDRVCCEVGGNSVSEECPKLDEIRDTNLSDGQIFGIIFVSLVVAEILGCFFCFYYKKKREQM